MDMLRGLTLIALAGVLVTAVPLAASEAPQRFAVGTLRCAASTADARDAETAKSLTCIFRAGKAGVNSYYRGRIIKFSGDMEQPPDPAISWTVWVPEEIDLSNASLAGRYASVPVDDPRVAGLGTNLMLGGENEAIVLEPIHGSQKDRADLAAAIATLELLPQAI